MAALCLSSPLLRRVVERYGMPPLWRREPGFASLVYAIIEQQVSLASARAIYERLLAVAGVLTPECLASIEDSTLRSIGFSRQKIDYCRGLAGQILCGTLNLEALDREDDETIRHVLTGIRGIGRWTADIYLLHSLGRPDVWPVGDLGLRVAVQEELALAERPGETRLHELGAPFVPWRSVAARIFWQGYLVRRGVGEVT